MSKLDIDWSLISKVITFLIESTKKIILSKISSFLTLNIRNFRKAEPISKI